MSAQNSKVAGQTSVQINTLAKANDSQAEVWRTIQTNLENSNWSCRSVGSARVMSGSEVTQQ